MKPADQKQNNKHSKDALPAGFLFLSKGQTAARKALGEIVSNDTNFLAITGPSGSGKTTLLNQFTQHLPSNVTLAQIIGYQKPSEGILHDVLIAFGQIPSNIDHSALLKALFDFLLEQHSQNKKPVLIIDKAETLAQDVLISFHSLSDLRSEGNVLLRVIFAGNTDFILHSSQGEFGSSTFLQPLIHIDPFTEAETYRYINRHYRLANRTKQISFSKRAAKLIYDYCHGNPLATYKLSGWALRLANWKKKKQVTHYFASKALKTPAWARFSEQFTPVHVENADQATSSTPKKRPKVIIFKCNQRIAEHDLHKKLVLLGRASGSTVVLRRPSVSRRHACLTILNHQVWIKNLSRTNKTYVNAEPIENHPLRDGDIIRIGDFLIFFIYEDTIATEAIPKSMKSTTPDPSNILEPELAGSAEPGVDTDVDADTDADADADADAETKINPVTPEVVIVPEENISVEASSSHTRKKRSLSVTERRNRKTQEHNKRWFLTAAAGIIALLGPMLAVIFLFGEKSTESPIEILAKMDKPSSVEISENTLQPAANDPELLAVEETPEPDPIYADEKPKSSEPDVSSSNVVHQNLDLSAPNDQLQSLIIEVREHFQNDELSQGLNLIIEGVKLEPENKDLLQLQVKYITRLAEKEQEWNAMTDQSDSPL